MNGPKENQQWSFGGINIDYEGIYPDTYTQESHYSHQLKLGEEIKSKIQALCFIHSEMCDGFENEMMWAQYAENHYSACLEFDEELLVEENDHLDFFQFENMNYDLQENIFPYWNLSLSKEENIDIIIKRYYKLLFLSNSHYLEKDCW